MRNSRTGWHNRGQRSCGNSEEGNLVAGRMGQDSSYILKGRSREALGPEGKAKVPVSAATAHIWGRGLPLRWLLRRLLPGR